MSELYKTLAVNDSKMEDETRIEGEWKIKVASPTSNQEGANPEQFMGMAWATCLNKTVQALMKARSWDNESRVRVEVTLHPQPETKGLYFAMRAFVAVEGLEMDKVEQLAEQAHRRCPVSKLIQANEHVFVEVETY
ncbi:osmotically inducible protein OsmC [Erysipelothrix sp. HDW6B]|uniref:OsmC family protein n=1 Tax=Erysipelothrix TaxID=1647 RepID=UPI00135BEEFF|nr:MULTISPECIES: OsmC family protein [Erysipelothrix]QIK86709.1 osmotically inducible protein OsmC [Erysipelothrix sp. HDW6B]